MKRSIMFGVLFSTALAVGASAQSTAGQTPTSSGSSSSDQQVTVTGCLQSGDAAGATGTSGAGSTGAGATGAGSTGAAGSGSSRSGFVLTNAKMGSGAGASSTGTAGSATGSASSAGMAGMTRIKLEGGSQSDLQKYANSQVEVTGKLDNKGTSGSGSTGSSSTGSATGSTGATGSTAASGAGASGSASGSRQDMPTLRVSNVRQVSPSCSGQ